MKYINLLKNFKNKQRSAVEARRAHNPEAVGSKPIVARIFLKIPGIFSFSTTSNQSLHSKPFL